MADLFQLPPKLTPEQMVVELNRRLRSIALALEAMTRPPREAVNHGGQRLTNVGRARADTDAITRQDLLDHSVFALEGNAAVAHRPLIAGGGIRVGKIARHKDEVVTLDQMGEHVDTMIATLAVMLGAAAGGDLAGFYPDPTVASVANAMFEDDPPAGARPGTAFTLSKAPNIVLVRHNLLWLKKVGGAPGVNEFSVAGANLTTGDTIGAGDDLYAVGWV